MTNYDFNRELEPLEFQNFARDILQVRENKIMESFRTTKDGGIDMRTKIGGKLVIGQAKRFKDFKSLKNNLKDEIEKVKKLNPDRYILITSVEDLETENKQIIMDMFCGYIKKFDDILGNQDLNNLLGRPEYKCVEINYMKLFLKTPNVLEYLLSDVVNRKIKVMSKIQLQEVFNNELTYIHGDFFDDAKNIIDENNCLLITGEAGVGKTSLAQHMCYELLLRNQDYKFYYVYSFEEILDVYNLDEKQIFFFDDFWGKFLKINNEDLEDKRMIDTICMILNDDKKKLILTSRGYIVDDILKARPDIREIFENKKIEIKLKDFSEVFKSKILFSYLKESNLERKDILHICNNYRKIINHNMYNPRTIIRFLDKASKDSKTGIYYDYCDELVKVLDNPESLIEEIFSAQKEETKIILILLMLMNVETDINVLKQMYVDYSKIDGNLKSNEFENAIKNIDGDLISLNKEYTYYWSPIMVKFKDPSIEEFVYKFFIKNKDEYIEKIVKSSTTLNLIVRVLGIINIFIKENEYTIHLSDKAKKIIASKIIEDYDELAYWYLPDFGERTRSCRIDKLDKVLEVNEVVNSFELMDFVEKECKKEIENLLNNDDKFSSEDMFYVTDIIESIKHSNLNIKLEPDKLIEGYINNIRFAKEFIYLEDFKKIFPKEFKKYKEENRQSIINKMLNLIIEDSEYFAEDFLEEDYYELVEETYPELFRIYDLKENKKFENKFAEYYHYEECENSVDIKEEMKKWKERDEEKRRIIEYEKQQLLGMETEFLEQEEAKEYIHSNVANESLENMLARLVDERYSEEMWYLSDFLSEKGALKWLIEFLKDIDYVPDAGELWQGFYEYVVDKIINSGNDDSNGLNDKVELIRDLFKGFEYGHFATTTDSDKYEIIMAGSNWMLKTEDIKKAFMRYSYDVKSLYSLCTGALSQELKDEVLFFISVRSFISKLSGEKIDIKEINENVAKMLEQAIQDDEMLQIGEVHNSNQLALLSNEILNKLAKMQKKNIAVEVLNRALKEYVEQVGKKNVVMMEKFSTKFQKIAATYNERTSVEDIEKIIQEMINLKNEIEEELKAENEYNLSIEEKAFFDALGNDPEVKELMKDDILVQIAKELVETVNSNMTIDWDIKTDARARMRIEIKKLLIKYHYPPNKSEKAVQTVIRQAELKCKEMGG